MSFKFQNIMFTHVCLEDGKKIKCYTFLNIHRLSTVYASFIAQFTKKYEI